MKTKHTPGPWYSQENGRDTYIYREGEGKHTQCMIGKVSKSQKEYEANANLMAAGPEMLERLEYVVSWLEDAKVHKVIVDHCKATIKKATS